MAVVYDPPAPAAAKGKVVYDQPAAAAPAAKKPAWGPQDLLGGIEAMLHMGSGMGASALAGLTGLGMGHDFNDSEAAADLIKAIQERATYQPQTRMGQAVSDVAGFLPGKIAQGADAAGAKVTDMTGSPAAGAGVNTVLQALPSLLLHKTAPKIKEASTAADNNLLNQEFLNAERDLVIQGGIKKGMMPLPAAANPTLLNRIVQGLSGEDRLAGALSRHNQLTGDVVARRAIDAGDFTPLHEGVQNAYSLLRNPDLIDSLPTLQRAIAPVSGHLDMTKLADLYVKGEPLHGDLEMLAKFAHENPSVVRLPKDVKGNALTLTDMGMGTVAAVAAANKYFAALSALRPMTRSGLAAKAANRALSTRDYSPSALRQLIANALTSQAAPPALAGLAATNQPQK